MAKFSELGIRSTAILGKAIDIEDLFDRRILIERTKVEPTKYPGKNRSNLRMQMQVVLVTFKDPEDLKPESPEYEVGLAEINEPRKAEDKPPIKSIYPLDVTIVKVGKCFQFQ